MGPVHRGLALLLQQLVALGEVAAAKEASMGGEGAGVDAGQEVVPAPVHHGCLLLRRGAPEEKHHAGEVLRDPGDDGVSQLLPALVLVGVGLALPHGEAGVQQEHALVIIIIIIIITFHNYNHYLIRPARKVAVTWPCEARYVPLELLEQGLLKIRTFLV